MKKCSLKCPVCAETFHNRVPRSWFLRYVLFFVHVKIYFCDHCKKRVYVVMADQEAFEPKPLF